MAYADGVFVMGRGSQDFAEILTSLVGDGNKMVLEINEKRQNLKWSQQKT
jgi:hypothetical protein